MSIVEGAPFHCYMHDFETKSVEEWNTHCFGNPEHKESGETACTSCGTKIIYEDLPWHKIQANGSKNISLKCEDCETKQMGTVKRTKA